MKRSLLSLALRFFAFFFFACPPFPPSLFPPFSDISHTMNRDGAADREHNRRAPAPPAAQQRLQVRERARRGGRKSERKSERRNERVTERKKKKERKGHRRAALGRVVVQRPRFLAREGAKRESD